MIHPYLTPDQHPELLALDVGNKVPCVWDPRYVSRAAPLTSTTKAGFVVEANAHKLALIQPPLDVTPDLWDSIAQWHTPNYVEAVRTGWPKTLAQSQGFTWSPLFAESVARIWAGQHIAQRLAHILGQPVLHPVSGAHHAHPGSGSGYCTFNYVVAGLALVKDDRPDARIAVIDLDAHYGDGTAEFARRHPDLDLQIFDVHGGPRWSKGYWNFGVATASEYRKALDHLPAWLAKHEITDAVYLAGVDPHEDDPIGGIPGVTEAFLKARDVAVLQALTLEGVSTVVNFAGGYVADKVTELHGNTIDAMTRFRDALPQVRAIEMGDQ